MDKLKEKKWWFLGAILLMVVILLSGLLINFSGNNGEIQGGGLNAELVSGGQTKLTYNYLSSTYRSKFKLTKNIPLSVKGMSGKTALNSGSEYVVTFNINGGNCMSDSKKCAYCLDPATNALSSSEKNQGYGTRTIYAPSSTANANYWKKLSASKQSMIELVLLYGYPNKLRSQTKEEQYIATQILIWEIQQGWRTNWNAKPTNTSFYNVWIKNYSNILAVYKSIVSDAANHNKVPKFTGGNSVKLEFNGTNYTKTLTDENNVLSQFTVTCPSGMACKKDGNKLTITASSSVSGTITLSKMIPANGVKGNLIIGSTSQQSLIYGYPTNKAVTSKLTVGTVTGGLVVKKTSEDGKIEGFKIQITGPNNYKETLTTDSNGEISISGLAPGEYTVKEVDVPNIYVQPEEQTVTVNGNSTTTITINNILKNTSTLKILKVDSETGEPLSGAKMCIYKAGTTLGNILSGNIIGALSGVANSCWTTDGKPHEVKFSEMGVAEEDIIGKYTICETEAPAGYEVDNDSLLPCKTIEIKDKNSAQVVVFENSPTKTVIKKTDEKGNLIGGAELKITSNDGSFSKTWTSETGKEFVIEGLSKNLSDLLTKYTIEEIKAPEGYQKAKAKTFTISEIGEEIIIENVPTEVEICKTDETRKFGVEGAHLQVIDSTGAIVHEWTTGPTEGWACERIEGLPVGNYVLHEETAPEGYLLADDIKFEVKDSGITEVVMTNKVTEVEISKVDATTGKEIAGAHLQVIDADEKVIDEWISEEGKTHIISKLDPSATYILRETIAPDGYAVSQEVVFTVYDEKVEMKNELTTVEILKKDVVSDEMVVGAHLQLLDKDGKVIEEWDTTEEAHVIKGLLTDTEYTVKETKAPNNYLIGEQVTFKLEKDEARREIIVYNTPIVHVKNTAANASTIMIVVGGVLIVAGIGAVIFVKKRRA